MEWPQPRDDFGSAAVDSSHDMGDEILAGSPQEWEYAMRREMQEIIPRVFLGPYASARKDKLSALQAAGITHILCVRQAQEARFVRPNFPEHFVYEVLDLPDDSSANIIEHFPRVRDFLDNALAVGGKVLMHGNAGISRSGSLLISYIMAKYHRSYSDALRLVQMRRFCVAPNEGFQAQLQEYEPIYRAQLMQQRFAEQAGVGAGVPRGGGSKRGFDETNANDDMEEYSESSSRNPAAFSEPVVQPPLPGHSAYVTGPEDCDKAIGYGEMDESGDGI